jgi:transcriptional regulator with XRE-family HTH domain
MTNATTPPKPWFVNGPSNLTRTGDTLPPELMEMARRRAIAARIREARERSRWTQPQIAEHLGIGLRAYQKVEQQGTSDYERCQELAEFLDVPGVDADYLWEGRPETPDLMGALSNPDERLARIEQKLDQVLEELADLQSEEAEELSDEAASEASRSGEQSPRKPGAASGSS